MQIPSRFLSGLFEAIGVGIRITDEDGKILAVNEHYCAIYGYSKEELIGKKITYLLSPAQGDEALRLYKQQFQLGTRETKHTNWEVINKKGETVIVNVSAFNVLDDEGNKFRVSIVKELGHAIRSQSEMEFHASILENVQDSLVVAGIDGKIIYWNQAASAIYGKNEEEVIGQELFPYLPAGELEGVISHFRQGNQILDFNEWQYYSPEGEEKYLNLRITPLLDSLGMLIGLIILIKDVSGQYRDKQQIREQRNMLASLLESQSNFLIRLSPEGRYTYSNKAYRSHGGYEEQILGQNFMLQVHPDDRGSWEKNFQLLKSSGEMQRLEFRMLKSNGELFWASWEFVVLQDDKDQHLAIQAVGVDISERKKVEQHRDYMLSQYQAINEELQSSEEELRQNLERTMELNKYIQHSEQRFRSLLENSFEALILYDEPGYITYASPTVEEVLGYSMEEMLGAKGMHYIHPDDKDQTRALLARMMEKPGNKVYILQRVRRKDGTYIWTEAYATNLLHDEHVKGVVSNFRDVTERIEREERLRSSEAFLNAAQHIAKIGSAEFDLASGKVRNSSGVYAIYDYDLEKYGEEGFFGEDYMHPEDVERVNKLFKSSKKFGPELFQELNRFPEAVLKEMESTPFEYRIISATGRLKYIRSNSRIFRDEKGKPLKVILTIQDITEEKYLERLLDETSHIAKIGGWEFDVEKNRIFWTEQTYHLFGISPNEDLSIERATEFYHPDYRPILMQAFQGLMSRGTPFDLELEMITESRKARWVRLIGQAEMVRNKVVLAKGTMQDITDKKKKEQEIRDYAERLRLATEAAGIGIWDWDFRRDIMLWDKQMLKMYGIRKEARKGGVEITHEEWRATLHPEDALIEESRLQESIEKGYVDEEFRILLPSGGMRWIKSYAKIFHDEQQKPLRGIGVNWDITKLKQIEEFLRRNNLELAKTNEELDHFVYSTSHNLRAPLTSIMGIISLIKHYRNPEEYLVYMELIEKSVQKLDETIMEITNYSRNTRVEVVREPVDFEALIKSVLESLSFAKEAGNIDITYKIPANLKFCSDTSRLKMILTNLLSNAIKYANPGEAHPFIMILIRKEGKGIQISVKDNGIGIAPEYHEKIFNMFFRATTHSHGSGLGLYIVKEAVHKLGGSLRVESSTGKGTTFMMKLPDLSA